MGRSGLALAVATVAASLLVTAVPVAAQKAAPAAAPAIEGPVWRLAETVDAGIAAAVPVGASADALFWAGTVSGSAGCGDYSTAYTLTPPAIVIDPATAGTPACDTAALELQERYLRLLPTAASFAVDGSELTLADATGAPLLRFTAAEVPAEVGIATWELVRLAQADGTLAPVADGTAPSARFLPGGRVVGDTGCGRFLGTYTTDGTDLAVSDLATRTGACDDGSPEAARATALLDVLARSTRFDVTPAGLSLLDTTGARLATWIPAPPPPSALWTPVEIRDADGKVLVSGAPLQTSVVSIDGETAGGRTNCHPWSAAVRRSGLALRFADLGVGKGSCRPPKVQKALVGALGATASYGVRGDRLELRDAAGNLVMRLVEQAPLADVSWEMTGILPASGGKLIPPVEKTLPTAVFSTTDGLVSGSTGCNDYAADFQASGLSVVISGALPSGRSCKAPIARQEDLFLDRLTAADAFIVTGTGLQLLDGDQVVLTFRPAAG